jgi:ubiquinone/menaquinone biosynthesis C-methylase UbiE/DNA-directed RNA polymerase subunit RPC12/RpoP
VTDRPVCDYEGSNYQNDFWGKGEREYEDQAEQIALKAMLPKAGRLFLEIGAGAGRQTPLLKNFDHLVLMDYSRTQLEQARERLGTSTQYTCVAANVYQLPFKQKVFDAAMMIRVMHHLVEPLAALKEVKSVIADGGAFILEFANKQNLKSILRYALRRQTWNPFSPESVEFVKLNFDFHPRTMRQWIREAGFEIQAQRSVSHYRIGALKKIVPPRWLAALDGAVQPTGEWLQFAPSIFVKCGVRGGQSATRHPPSAIFVCPHCKSELTKESDHFRCTGCGKKWGVKNGIYDFKEAL